METYICRDTMTGNEIARGTLDEMRAFLAAFGLCYIAPAYAAACRTIEAIDSAEWMAPDYDDSGLFA